MSEGAAESKSDGEVGESDVAATGSGARPVAKTPAREHKRRSPRQVKAAAKMLKKEAAKILGKHAKRIAAEPAQAMRESVAVIDELTAAERWVALEDEAERLDELLHRHASFARKSPLRETLENIGIAVLIALGLRTCLYEPFKIPSGSMMPTLRPGDHIFVNKFVYGIQLPFTTTVVGESWGDIERGDVVVFRFPLDESQDYIKRVIGLPGDEVRVRGRQVSLKRPGEDDFEPLPRTRLEDRCFDEEGVKPVANCTLYEETLDDKTYVVRYLLQSGDRGDLTPEARTWKVPEGHLLVMGDNRNRSEDSTAWTVKVEAVGADKILTSKDLRDLTAEQLFSLKRPDTDGLGDPLHDQVTYESSHRSPAHDLQLSVWRQPTLGADAVYEALARGLHGSKATTLADLRADGELPKDTDRAALEGHAGLVGKLTVGADEEADWAVALLPDSQTVLALSCGRRVCRSPALLGATLGEVLSRYAVNERQDSRSLLPQTKLARYTSEWTGRHDPRDHLYERALGKKEDAEPRDRVRMRAFRHPDETIELVRDAALAAVGHSTDSAAAVSELGNDAWQVTTEDEHIVVATDHARQFAVVLQCGRNVCRGDAKAVALAVDVMARVPAAAGDRRKMKDLLLETDVPGLIEMPVAKPELYEFDRIRREATVRGKEHSLVLAAWLKPPEGLPAKIAEMKAEAGVQMEADQGIAEQAWYAYDEGAHVYVIGVPESETVIALGCFEGLCPDRQTAAGLARRAATKALDATTFVDPQAERPRPFVPRGNVKGRAERIWLPFSRFWLPIR